MADRDFWDDRTAHHGHTGWSDPVIYAFDQRVRRQVIAEVLDTLPFTETEVALDFGCGSGDFSGLLSSRFRRVIGFDISERVLEVARAKRDRSNIDFRHAERIECLELPDNYLDVVLSVTVLGHVLPRSDVSRTLAFLRAKLKLNGYFVALEFIDTFGLRDNEYQSFRSFAEWTTLFGENGFQLERDYGLFYPPTGSATYRRYLNDTRIRLYQWCRGPRLIGAPAFVQRRFDRIASKSLAASPTGLYWDGTETDNMKTMIFRRLAAPARAPEDTVGVVVHSPRV